MGKYVTSKLPSKVYKTFMVWTCSFTCRDSFILTSCPLSPSLKSSAVLWTVYVRSLSPIRFFDNSIPFQLYASNLSLAFQPSDSSGVKGDARLAELLGISCKYGGINSPGQPKLVGVECLQVSFQVFLPLGGQFQEILFIFFRKSCEIELLLYKEMTLINILTFTFLSSLNYLSCYFTLASWDHLTNKIATPKSLPQTLL